MTGIRTVPRGGCPRRGGCRCRLTGDFTAVKVLVSLAFVALVFVAAGTVRWTAFWVLLGFYFATTGGWMLWLKRRDPGLLKERMTGGTRRHKAALGQDDHPRLHCSPLDHAPGPPPGRGPLQVVARAVERSRDLPSWDCWLPGAS